MNILITAIGSMSADAAIESFRKIEDTVLIGCDTNPKEWLPNSRSLDFFHKAPKSNEKGYLPFIVELCKRYEINFVVPLTDPEVDIFSEKRFIFEQISAIICIPKPSAIEICRNKLLLYKHFEGSKTVKVIPSCSIEDLRVTEISFPFIAKPKNGRSSEGIFYIKNKSFLEIIREEWDNYIFQPIIEGEIFTVDFLRSKSGKSVSVARKELKRTRTGAGLTVETTYIPQLHRVVTEIGGDLDILGCINMEFIYDGLDFYLMDINPRFSAGVVFSLLTGYDMCKNHLSVFRDMEIEDFNEKPLFGLYAKQYHELKL